MSQGSQPLRSSFYFLPSNFQIGNQYTMEVELYSFSDKQLSSSCIRGKR